MKKINLLLTQTIPFWVLFFLTLSSFAQDNEQSKILGKSQQNRNNDMTQNGSVILLSSGLNDSRSETIGVYQEKSMRNTSYVFRTNAPDNAYSWTLTVSEFTGIPIFTDSGETWDENGYVWKPTEDIQLFSGIYYVLSISFFNEKRAIVDTEATRFYVPLYITANATPILFFEGDTVENIENIYEDSSTQKVIDYIVREAESTYLGYRILIRGHASFVSDNAEARQKEQIELLDLSRRRALLVLEKIIDAGVDSTRLAYEAYGGSREFTDQVDSRWKNRRVEVLFVNDDEQDAIEAKIDDNDSNIDVSIAINSDKPETPQVPPPDTPSNPLAVDVVINNRNPENGNIDEPKNDVVFVPYYVVTPSPEPWPDLPILGQGELSPEHMYSFMLYKYPTRDEVYKKYLERIILYYINESKRESVNHDIAFAQMLLETDFLRYTGQVRREQNNFAGIGVVNEQNSGNWFSTELIGVRAHIQHLRGYATTQPLRGNLVDPRYPILDRLGLLGVSPLVSTLSGRWATDPEYSKKILIILRRMYNYSNFLTSIGE